MAAHLITGAGSGIGAVLAERLQERGEELWLLARDAWRATELRERFSGARTLVGDLGDPVKLSWAFGQQQLPEGLDSLLHVAGVIELGQVGDLPVRTWQEMLNVNLVAPAELTRLMLPSLRQAKGHVVFVNSSAGLTANAERSAYGASKHGLRALADSLRQEEHAGGVRVTTVYPGRTATAMQVKVHQQEGREYDPARFIAPESVAGAVLAALDASRDAEITDITVRPGR